MTIASGTEVYNADEPPVRARGLAFDADELAAALDGPVAAIIRDDSGVDEVEDLLLGVGATEFDPEAVKAVFCADHEPEDWRVGEALAEAFLAEHRGCMFPWPVSRDEKDPNASMPGTDLVGFRETGEESRPTRFAFGEVKTSEQQEYPPSLMYGRHGLKSQLEDLRDREPVRQALVIYLAHRAVGRDWGGDYRAAFGRYIQDAADVAVFGLMIRDVEPNERDLQARARNLANGLPDAMVVELYAFYLPSGSISGLGQQIRLSEEGDHASN